jgi:hypothetical protein
MSAVYCACGAQWHGRTVTRAKDIIAMHRHRGGPCWMMSHGAFKHTYRCHCDACRTKRSIAWRVRRSGGRGAAGSDT